jgi:hypothetical protein
MTLAEALRELLKYPFDTRGKWSPVWANAREALAAHDAQQAPERVSLCYCPMCKAVRTTKAVYPCDECGYEGDMKPEAQQQEPTVALTAQQLDALIERHVGGNELNDGEYSSMVIFAAAVERAHGIGTSHDAQQQEPVGWIESPHGAFRANPNYRWDTGPTTVTVSIPLYTKEPTP